MMGHPVNLPHRMMNWVSLESVFRSHCFAPFSVISSGGAPCLMRICNKDGSCSRNFVSMIPCSLTLLQCPGACTFGGACTALQVYTKMGQSTQHALLALHSTISALTHWSFLTLSAFDTA